MGITSISELSTTNGGRAQLCPKLQSSSYFSLTCPSSYMYYYYSNAVSADCTSTEEHFHSIVNIVSLSTYPPPPLLRNLWLIDVKYTDYADSHCVMKLLHYCDNWKAVESFGCGLLQLNHTWIESTCNVIFITDTSNMPTFLEHKLIAVDVPKHGCYFNPLKRSGVRWLHFKVFSAIQV